MNVSRSPVEGNWPATELHPSCDLLVFESCEREALAKPLGIKAKCSNPPVMGRLLPERQESKPANGKEYTRISAVLVLAGPVCLERGGQRMATSSGRVFGILWS